MCVGSVNQGIRTKFHHWVNTVQKRAHLHETSNNSERLLQAYCVPGTIQVLDMQTHQRFPAALWGTSRLTLLGIRGRKQRGFKPPTQGPQ